MKYKFVTWIELEVITMYLCIRVYDENIWGGYNQLCDSALAHIYIFAHDVLVWHVYYLKVYIYIWWCFSYGENDGCVLSYNM